MYSVTISLQSESENFEPTKIVKFQPITHIQQSNRANICHAMRFPGGWRNFEYIQCSTKYNKQFAKTRKPNTTNTR